MSPRENIIISQSFEDIVFSNRNREYGAFILRKKQKKHLIIAFLVSFFLVSSSVLVPLISNHLNGPGPFTNDGIVIYKMDSTLNVLPPEVPEVKIDDIAKTQRFVPPVVVDTVENETDIITAEEALEESDPGTVPDLIAAIEEVEPEYEVPAKPFISVEIPATFDGGDINNFNKWVLANVKYPQLAIENGITGKVFVQFVVNSKGKVEGVTILRGADPLLDQEASRVIESSPKWTAPLQGGKPVKQLFTLPVVFKLSQ